MSLKKRVVSVRTRVAMLFAFIVVLSLLLPSSSFLNRWAVRTVLADTAPQTLPFSQNWTNTGLITTNDIWSGVPGIIGYRGDDLTTVTATDPQTILADGAATPVDVNANQTAPDTFATGGVTEFEIANPVVALTGSGTADAPHIVLALNTTGQSTIGVSYNLRDIDGSVDNAIQPVALQYRVGASGNYTNLPAGFVADASSGPSLATLVTPVSVTLPAACDNQPIVHVRIMSTNAVGNDEWIGIDDISVTTGVVPTILNVNDVAQAEGNAGTTTFTFTVSLTSPAGAGGVTFDIATADGTAQDDNPVTEDNDYVAKSLSGQTIGVGNTSTTFTVDVNGDVVQEPNETFLVNVTNISGANAGDTQGQGTIQNDDVTVVQIHDIQGNGVTSPLNGSSVSTSGTVTLLKSNGFFLQEPDATVDADPNTSEGIFVFTSSAPTVVLGNAVTVTGTVTEFGTGGTITELSSVTSVVINSTGNPLPAAIPLTPTILDPTALPSQPQLEKFESMRMTGALNTVSPNDIFFDVGTVLSSVARPIREIGLEISATIPPDPTSGLPDVNIPRWDENPERLSVDTNGRAGSTGLVLTSNVSLGTVTGVLDFAFAEYHLIPDFDPNPSPNMTFVPVPVPLATEFTVGCFNIENFANGATQRQKAARAIRQVMRYPDIIGHEEIASLAALQALRDQVNNDAVGAGDPNPLYEAYLTGTGAQNVGFLVKTARVSVISVTEEPVGTYINPLTGLPEALHDRPPLTLRATVDPTGPNPIPVIVVVNHPRSFIAIEEDPSPPGDGARVRAKRKAQGESIAALLDTLQDNNPGNSIMTVGDFNAFQFNDGYTDPIATIKGTPTADDQIVVDASPDLVSPDFVNLTDTLPVSERYSFVFEGTPQALDHVIVNRNAITRFTRYAIARFDADFPDIPAAAFVNDASRPERASDHDAPVAYFNLTTAPTAADGTVTGRITDANGAPIAGAIVNLSGTQNRKFITDANGNYRFENVETGGFYTVRPSRVNYSFSPAERSFSQLGNITEATFTGSLVDGGFTNPLDTPEYFVRQHYLDFLNRDADESGFNFWSDQILSCGEDSACIERRSINVSAAYFLSIEFQHTGGLVDGLYRASYGRRPQYAEFLPDAQTVGQGVIVGTANWAQNLAANKRAFIAAWVGRPDFRAAYDGLGNSQYVDALISHTGVDFSPGERDALVNSLANGATRAEVLGSIADDGRFVSAKRNEMFVLMQYFGYLRRDPDASGYAFWLNKLNQFNGNFEQAEMVKAFINSAEYRARFQH